MDKQEWFERFEVKLTAEAVLEKQAMEDCLHGQIWIKEQWSIARYALLKMALHQLPSLPRKIVRLIFFEDLSEREVAERLRLSKTQVHRLKDEALRMMARSRFVKLALWPRLLTPKSIKRSVG